MSATEFNRLYDTTHVRVYGYLRRLTREAVLTDDLFQETWIKVARALDRLRPGSNAEAWLFTIARNTFLNHRRWQLFDLRRTQQATLEFVETPTTEPSVDSAGPIANCSC